MNVGGSVLCHCPSQSRRELPRVFGMNYAGRTEGPEALAPNPWMPPWGQHGFPGVRPRGAAVRGWTRQPLPSVSPNGPSEGGGGRR